MTTRITQNSVAILIVPGVFIGLSFNECLGSQTCKNNSGSTKHVCVAWDRQAAPEEGEDFDVDYACQGCSDDPAVELITGDLEWVVYSEVISTGDPANIGALTTPDSENYVVKIANGLDFGAANVGSMVLTPNGGSYYSSIASDSRISGDLTGNLTLQKASGGSGGSASLRISGKVVGDMTIPKLNVLTIGNEFSGSMVIDELAGEMSIGVVSPKPSVV